MESADSTLTMLEELTGERPLAAVPMAGATSSDLFLLRYPGKRQVLRLFRAARWDTSTDDLSARESSILAALSACDVAAPEPVRTLPGNGVLMSWLPGTVELPRQPASGWTTELARRLAGIHRLDLELPFSYVSWNETATSSRPGWWQQEALWSDAQALTAETPDYQPVFIHRDYHPLNVLWQGDRISGIVDWINACMGPSGIDVAHCRLNLAIMYGQPQAELFLHAYNAAMPGYEHDFYWDLEDALSALPDVKPYPPWAEFGLTGLTLELVRERLQAFVQAAVGRK